MSDITLQPVAKTWKPRTNRDHVMTPHLVSALMSRHYKRLAGKAYTNPSIEISRDQARQRNEVAVSWLEADLPPGQEDQRIIVPDEGSELQWELHTP